MVVVPKAKGPFYQYSTVFPMLFFLRLQHHSTARSKSMQIVQDCDDDDDDDDDDDVLCHQETFATGCLFANMQTLLAGSFLVILFGTPHPSRLRHRQIFCLFFVKFQGIDMQWEGPFLLPYQGTILDD